MQIKRYEAVNMREATTRIKQDLGADAVILSTKQLSKNPPLIEVTAARDQDIVSPPGSRQSDRKQCPDDFISGLRQEIGELKSCVDSLAQQSLLKADILELKDALNILCDSVSVRNNGHLHKLYLSLIANGTSRIRALKLTQTIKNNAGDFTDNYDQTVAAAEKLIAGYFRRDDRQGLRIKAFVGPTGVGKTTTLAKLAAQYCIEKKLKVGLITTDTYRIAAAEQLKIYAKIMGLPIAVAADKEKFSRSLKSFADKDLILVDTPGRSRHDDHCTATLKSILTGDVETFLLMSPIAGREYLMDTAERFRIFNYDRIILTKIDECRQFGRLVDVLEKIDKPVAYLTTGQNVPKDIETASPERLAKLTLQNRHH